MDTPNLESLFLTERSLKKARQQIERIALANWHEAGCPQSCERDFWSEAHAEWIRSQYVPDLNFT